MMTLEEIQKELVAAIPGCRVTIVPNGSVSGQHSLLVEAEHATEVARWLRDYPALRLDYCSNASGVDWLDSERTEKTKVKKVVDGEEKEVEETVKRKVSGYLEAVYHLYSMERKEGLVVLRMRTGNRTDQVHLPSLTPIWRGAELQEREIFDLYGIVFDGHPDLRRLLMWDDFLDHPMRKDYVNPNDEPETEAVTASEGRA